VAKNPFKGWLSRLRPAPPAAPKKLADFQWYMQCPEFKGKVDDAYNMEKETVAASGRLALRAKVARTLFLAELEEVQQRMKEEAATEHDLQTEQHEDALQGLPAVDEEGKAE
jgi:hypothetical protein